MELFNIILLALIQGITEFLPISSSGHLILFPALTGAEDQGLLMDVAVHLGTLGAVLVYFRHEVWGLAVAIPGALRPAPSSDKNTRLLRALVLATLPVIVGGYLFVRTGLSDMLRSAEVIAWASIIFGLLLFWVDRRRPESRGVDTVTVRDALTIGLAQVLALIPGTSRAGITMTMARGLNITRTDAARFSMLLSIPTIAAAGALAVLDLSRDYTAAALGEAALAAGLSFAAAIGAIHFLLRWLAHASMTIFVVYRVALGVFILIWAWT